MHMISQSMAESRSMGLMEGHLLIVKQGGLLLWEVEVVDQEGLSRFLHVAFLLMSSKVRSKPMEGMLVEVMVRVRYQCFYY